MSTPTDVTPPLNTPTRVRLPDDILDIIFEHAEARTHAAAAGVCIAWAWPALRALWLAPNPGFVRAKLSLGRKLFYSSFIRHVRLRDATLELLADWHFPAARRLSVLFDYPFWHPWHTEVFINALARCGRRLEHFGLFPTGIYAANRHDARVLCHLAIRPGLRVLDYKVFVSAAHFASTSAFLRALAPPQQPFRSLRILSIAVKTTYVRQFVAFLVGNNHGAPRGEAAAAAAAAAPTPTPTPTPTTQLGELEVLVRGRLDKFLADFAPLAPTLRKLYIELHIDECWMPFAPRDFRTLARLTQLRMLRLSVGLNRKSALNFYRPQRLGVVDVVDVAASLPHLHTLLLDFDVQWSDEWFVQLGARCGRLERLELHAPLNLALAPASAYAPLYPRLRELFADSAKSAEDRSDADVAALAASHAATMRYHAPRLALLDIHDGDRLDVLVQETLQTLKGSDVEKTTFHTDKLEGLG